MISKSYQDVRIGTREESLEMLSEERECVDVMWNGRSFHMSAPATGNARLPTVESRTGGRPTSRR